MKRIWIVTAIVALVAAASLSGCGAAPSNSSSSSSSPSSEISSSEPSSEEASSVPVALDKTAYEDALKGITDYEAGTAGSSLKLSIAAAQLLNFTETFVPEQLEELTAVTGEYLASLDEKERSAFEQNLSLADEQAQKIIAADKDALAMLSDAGSPQKYDSYSLDKYNAVKTVIDNALLGESSQQ